MRIMSVYDFSDCHGASPGPLRAQRSRPLALTHHVFANITHVDGDVAVDVDQNLAGQHDGDVFVARFVFLQLGESIT